MKVTLVFLSLALAGSLAAARQSNPDLQPIGITQTHDHDFPDSLARMFPNGGKARILVTIRADGELAEWLITGYSAPEFKAEATTALKGMKFSPARYKGERIAARSEITLTFEVRGMLISTSSSIESFEVMSGAPSVRSGYYAVPVEKLDRLPKVLRAVSPNYPKELADRGVAGSVVVDFYIDEEGTVQMPSMLQPEASPLSDAAVTAIRQWKFEPPLRHGKPALAHAQQVFNFGSNPRNGG